MQRKDWTLLAITAARARGLSPIQLQKTLFLLEREMPAAVAGRSFYDFKPYHYGPFDRTVYTDAEELAVSGEVEITQRQGENWTRYVIARDGEVRASYIEREVPEAMEYMTRLVKWVQDQTFQGLVSAIYNRYPEMKTNSVFQG